MPLPSPHPIDLHVGARLRVARTMRKVSQEALAQTGGITFQQVQKYERGSNRISASMLYAFASRLDLPVSWFFEGLEPEDAPSSQAGAISTMMAMREGAQLALLMASLPVKLQRQVIALMRDFAMPADIDTAA